MGLSIIGAATGVHKVLGDYRTDLLIEDWIVLTSKSAETLQGIKGFFL